MVNRKKLIGTIVLYIASFCWGSAFIAQKILVDLSVPPFFTIGLRFSIAILLLFFIDFKKISKYTIYHGIVLGIMIFLVFSLQTYGLKTIDSSVSAFITGLNLVFIPIISIILFKHKINMIHIIAVCISLLGTYFFNIREGTLFIWNTGVFLTLLCAIGVAFQLSYGNIFYKEEKYPFYLVIIQNATCSVIAFIFGFFLESFPQQWTMPAIFSLIYLALIASLLAYGLLAIGQKLEDNIIKVGIILAMQPLFTVFISVFFFGEMLTIYKMLGIICIVFAIMLTEWQIIKSHQ
ncbi:EamA domain-containing membrane protein RarD [Brevinema andersonii]|uniref:EamA domain-containing membrane protein RarD n=1 Tax=Brevinema andersonii TaxID=34097 RepID=A0A1I1ER03_BREAD|nr:DMT family transporter [Brevinema andersonii]SFB89082.1 EamA domain-containing membrane protein RarD [Brevinema andersonii]